LQVLQFVGDVLPLVSVGRWGLASGDAGPVGQARQLHIERDHVLLVGWDVFFGVNGRDWTLGNAHGAVNAFVWVNGEEVGPLSKAVHWTDIDTIGVLAVDTGFGDNVGHGRKPGLTFDERMVTDYFNFEITRGISLL
jgi:hypothetical protein